jgi:hypothetical protein
MEHVCVACPHPFWPDGGPAPFALSRRWPPSGADGCSRVTSGRVGPLTMVVWLVFDRAVRYGDRDGPYREGEILSEYFASK